MWIVRLADDSVQVKCEAFFALLLATVDCIVDITKTRLFKYIENFTSKNWKLKILIFFIFLLKI